MRHLASHSLVLLQIWLCPQLNFFLGLCWTLCTWDKWYLDKLVSPRGLCWTSTTKIDYRKWLSPFPFQSPPFWWLMPTQTKANIKCRNLTSLLFWQICKSYLNLNQLKEFQSLFQRICKNKLSGANVVQNVKLEENNHVYLEILSIGLNSSNFCTSVKIAN